MMLPKKVSQHTPLSSPAYSATRSSSKRSSETVKFDEKCKKKAKASEEALKQQKSFGGSAGGVCSEDEYPFTIQAHNNLAGHFTAEQVKFLKTNFRVVGPKASKEFEDKWKKLQFEETELLVEKFQLLADHTKLVLDAM